MLASAICIGILSATPATTDFVLSGLGKSYRFVREFRLPAPLSNLSGIAASPLSPDGTLDLWAVLDGRHTGTHPGQALLRLRFNPADSTLELATSLPVAADYSDLEGIAADFTPPDGPLFFLADEGGSRWGGCSTRLHVVGPDGKPRYPSADLRDIRDHQPNVCAEAIALRREGERRMLYLFKERNPDGSTPDAFEYEWNPRSGPVLRRRFRVGQHGLHDQTAAEWIEAARQLWVLHRIGMEIVAVDPDAIRFPQPESCAPVLARASYRRLERQILAYTQPKFPMAEGLAVRDPYLWIAIDNNGEAVGRSPDPAARLWWFVKEDLQPEP